MNPLINETVQHTHENFEPTRYKNEKFIDFKAQDLQYLKIYKQQQQQLIQVEIQQYKALQDKNQKTPIQYRPELKRKIKSIFFIIILTVRQQLKDMRIIFQEENDYLNFKKKKILGKEESVIQLNNKNMTQINLQRERLIESLNYYEILKERLNFFNKYYQFIFFYYWFYIKIQLPILLAKYSHNPQEFIDFEILFVDNLVTFAFFIDFAQKKMLKKQKFLVQQAASKANKILEQKKEYVFSLKKVFNYFKKLFKFLPVFQLFTFLDFLQFDIVNFQFLCFIQWYKIFVLSDELLNKSFLNQRIQKLFENNKRYFIILNDIFEILLMCHIIACAWIFLNHIYYTNYYTFFEDNNIVITDYTDIYVSSLYWCVQTICSVGYGDMQTVPRVIDRIPMMIFMIGGALINTYWISVLCNLLSSGAKKEILSNKIQIMEQFINSTQTDNEQFQKIYKFLTQQGNNIQKLKYEELNQIFWLFPQRQKKALILGLYSDLADNQFFASRNDQFRMDAVLKLKLFKFNKGEMIYEKNQSPNSVYFIKDGKVNFITKKIAVFKSYVAKSYFGEIEIIQQMEQQKMVFRTFSVRAEETTNVYYMIRHQFQELIQKYPEYYIELKEIALKRMKRNQKAREMIKFAQVLNQNSQFWNEIQNVNIYEQMDNLETKYTIKQQNNYGSDSMKGIIQRKGVMTKTQLNFQQKQEIEKQKILNQLENHYQDVQKNRNRKEKIKKSAQQVQEKLNSVELKMENINNVQEYILQYIEQNI